MGPREPLGPFQSGSLRNSSDGFVNQFSEKIRFKITIPQPDFNAHSTLCGCGKTDNNGLVLDELLEER